MGYQALLFCPDEKTARTVTQVLSELEFSVESSTEPFAAVKKLMAEHFDAVVVDCDNEQNATLLFKSARNSASNQASLAVAVVEGQAGVAKAFRIGANLVLTKPINVEQAKGTLRVARGLLRKGDPAKTAAPAASTQTPTPTKSAAPRPVAPVAKPAPLASKPVQAAAASQTSALGAAAPQDAKPAGPVPMSSAAPAVSNVSSPIGGSGAASAAAPARAGQAPEFEPSGTSSASSDAPKAAAGTVDLDHAAGPSSEPSVPAPSFTFGGANAPADSMGGASKKALMGVAAVVVVGVGLYFAWAQFHGKSTAPSSSVQPPVASNPVTPQAKQPSKPQPTQPLAPASSSPISSTSTGTAAPSGSEAEQPDSADEEADSPQQTPEKTTSTGKNSTKPTTTGSAAATKPAAETKPAPQPMMIKNGATAPAQPKLALSDAAAPSVLGIAPSPSGGGLPNLVGNSNAPKPVLQILNVSQGVSQGLLIKKVQPTYPPTAIRMHVEGAVQLMATIGKDGSITAVKATSGEPVLSKAALDAVKQWKYKPYYLNGEPVEIQTQVTVNFKLPR